MVISVVASAISTSMVNSVGEMTPRSRPMLRTMSSIRPRAFIKTPMVADSRQLRPHSLAATRLPPNLPAHATATMRPHRTQACPESSSPIWVRRPLKAKNIGSRNTTTKSSSLSVSRVAKPPSRGMMTPSTKAPNRAWMPMTSVAQLEARSKRNVPATTS